MPRVTLRDYCIRHHELRSLWLGDPRVFTLFEPAYQAEIYRFYMPARDMTDYELAVHRRHIAVREPSLSNRAGKHYARIKLLLPRISELVPREVINVDGIIYGGQSEEFRRVARACIALARWQRDGSKLRMSKLD